MMIVEKPGTFHGEMYAGKLSKTKQCRENWIQISSLQWGPLRQKYGATCPGANAGEIMRAVMSGKMGETLCIVFHGSTFEMKKCAARASRSFSPWYIVTRLHSDPENFNAFASRMDTFCADSENYWLSKLESEWTQKKLDENFSEILSKETVNSLINTFQVQFFTVKLFRKCNFIQ